MDVHASPRVPKSTQTQRPYQARKQLATVCTRTPDQLVWAPFSFTTHQPRRQHHRSPHCFHLPSQRHRTHIIREEIHPHFSHQTRIHVTPCSQHLGDQQAFQHRGPIHTQLILLQEDTFPHHSAQPRALGLFSCIPPTSTSITKQTVQLGSLMVNHKQASHKPKANTTQMHHHTFTQHQHAKQYTLL